MFKTKFKFFKNIANIPDPGVLERDLIERKIFDYSDNFEDDTFSELHLNKPSLWNVYEHAHHQGLILVKNVFTHQGQWYWISRCVTDYPAPPNLNNLAPIGLLAPDENWFDVCLESPDRGSSILKKLRWVTLGYHHNWDTKVYSEKMRSPFPDDLAQLCRIVAKIATGWDFSAQAAIINYYYHNSTISGHVDHSEPNLDAPLLSFSFGDSALFLIGNDSDDVSPVMLKSGDVAIMSGPSRLAMHGVPRIVPADERPWELTKNSGNSTEKDKFVIDFINEARINMNVRQVLYPGSKTL